MENLDLSLPDLDLATVNKIIETIPHMIKEEDWDLGNKTVTCQAPKDLGYAHQFVKAVFYPALKESLRESITAGSEEPTIETLIGVFLTGAWLGQMSARD